MECNQRANLIGPEGFHPELGRSLGVAQIGDARLKLDACTRQRSSLGIDDPDNPRDARFECQITVNGPSVHGCVDLRQYVEMSQHSVRNDRQVIDCRCNLSEHRCPSSISCLLRYTWRRSVRDREGRPRDNDPSGSVVLRPQTSERLEARCVGNVRVVARRRCIPRYALSGFPDLLSVTRPSITMPRFKPTSSGTGSIPGVSGISTPAAR